MFNVIELNSTSKSNCKKCDRLKAWNPRYPIYKLLILYNPIQKGEKFLAALLSLFAAHPCLPTCSFCWSRPILPCWNVLLCVQVLCCGRCGGCTHNMSTLHPSPPPLLLGEGGKGGGINRQLLGPVCRVSRP